MGKPALAAGFAIALLLTGYAFLPSASADRTPIMEQMLPTSREGTSAVSADDSILIFGGYDGGRLDDILRYTPAVGTLETQEAKLPTPRTGTAAVWDGTHAYVFGGLTDAGFSDEILRYDPQTDSLEVLDTTLPSGRVHAAAAWDGEHAYLVGGTTTCDSCATDQIVRFDPDDLTVTVMDATLPEPRSAVSAAYTGSDIIITGGFSSKPHQRYDDVLHFDPSTDHLAPSDARLPHGLSHASATSLDSRLYLFGGLGCDSGACDTILSYEPGSGQVEEKATLLQSGRQLTSAAGVDGHIYIFGGTGNSRFDEILHYSPAGSPPPNPLPPVLKAVTDTAARVGQSITIPVEASHPADKPLTLSAEEKPAGMDFTDHGDGTGELGWTPQIDDEGPHGVTIRASDGARHDTKSFTLTVNPADAPIIETIWDRSADIGDALRIDVKATDPEDRTITLEMTDLPDGATFTDHGDGEGRFEWDIQLDQDGEWAFEVRATAGDTTSHEPFKITVRYVILAPQFESETDHILVVDQDAEIPIEATQPQGEPIILSHDALPSGAQFNDQGNGQGTLTWTPRESDVGEHEIRLRADASGRTLTETLRLDVIRELDIELDTLDPVNNIMTPGETRNLPTRVTNTGNQTLTIELDGAPKRAQEAGWKVESLAPVTLDPGEATVVDMNVTAPAKATHAMIRLEATGHNVSGEPVKRVTHWMIDVPVHITLTLDRDEPGFTTAASEGVHATVNLTWANGSQAVGVDLMIHHTMDGVPQYGPDGALAHQHEAQSDNNGQYVFSMGNQDPASLVPGDHTITATAIRGDREDRAIAHYTVRAG